ncbi:SCO3374 family protein [Streptomyces capparidis]
MELLTGVCFDALDVPLAAGLAVLGRLGGAGTGPVAAGEGRVWFLAAPGSAEELPGLLDWLDWGGIALDLVARGTGGRLPAPAPPDAAHRLPVPAPRVPASRPREAADRALPVWVRPPRPGQEAVLPAAGLPGARRTGSPDLVRLVAAAADACHRARLFPAPPRRRSSDQACAFS